MNIWIRQADRRTTFQKTGSLKSSNVAQQSWHMRLFTGFSSMTLALRTKSTMPRLGIIGTLREKLKTNEQLTSDHSGYYKRP